MEQKTCIIDFFNGLADRWDDIAENNKKEIDFILDCAKLKSGSHVLDIGCGTGILEAEILKYNPEKILAIDIAEKMILQARRKFSDDRIEFRHADIYALNETSFDCAFIFNAYPHFLEKEALAEKLSFCLNTGGRFIIAHDCSRKKVNARHKGISCSGKKEDGEVYSELKSAETEAAVWRKYFSVDMLTDTDTLYVISGIKN